MKTCAWGFSLLELLVTVSVAGTLATVAMPSLSRLVQDSRRTTIVNELLATARAARADAARLGHSVVICGFDDANGNRQPDAGEYRCGGRDWSAGWFAASWTDLDEDGRVDPDELGEPLRVFANTLPRLSVRTAGFGNAPAPSGVAVMRPFDRTSSNGTLTVCDARGAPAARALVLAGNGRARIAARTADDRELACP